MLQQTLVTSLCAETGGCRSTVHTWLRGQRVSPLSNYALRAACDKLGFDLPEAKEPEPAPDPWDGPEPVQSPFPEQKTVTTSPFPPDAPMAPTLVAKIAPKSASDGCGDWRARLAEQLERDK